MEKLKELLKEINIENSDKSALDNRIFKEAFGEEFYVSLEIGYSETKHWIEKIKYQDHYKEIEITLKDEEILKLININL